MRSVNYQAVTLQAANRSFPFEVPNGRAIGDQSSIMLQLPGNAPRNSKTLLLGASKHWITRARRRNAFHMTDTERLNTAHSVGRQPSWVGK
jgi:hypothetical protein